MAHNDWATKLVNKLARTTIKTYLQIQKKRRGNIVRLKNYKNKSFDLSFNSSPLHTTTIKQHTPGVSLLYSLLFSLSLISHQQKPFFLSKHRRFALSRSTRKLVSINYETKTLSFLFSSNFFLKFY